MRRTLLLALLGLALAQAAAAHPDHIRPVDGVRYQCWYWNDNSNAKNPGFSIFDIQAVYQDGHLLRGIEFYDALLPNGTQFTDNRKFSFAKPVDIKGWDEYGNWVVVETRWEFTFNPSGPQCTLTRVDWEGSRIRFRNCSDGHSRDCYLYP